MTAGSTIRSRVATMIPYIVRYRLAGLRARLGLVAPVNYTRRNASDAAVVADVDYALGVAARYRNLLTELGVALPGLRILELGPGWNFGSMVALAALGAKPAVADRFLAPWEDSYHPRFYSRLAARLREWDAAADPSVALAAMRNHGEVVQGHLQGAEDIQQADASIDVVVSNAVLEHLLAPPAAFANLARLTSPGGYGIHQVDFRDHRDFSRPLELLLYPPARFERLADSCNRECGCQIRPSEMSELFAEAGFTVQSYTSNAEAGAAYLAGFMPRLQRAKASRYRDWSTEALQSVSGLYILRR